MYINIKFRVPEFIERLIVAIALRHRRKKYGYAFRKIKLTKGKYAIVDPEDYDKINQYNWYTKDNGYTFYAERKERIFCKKRSIRMHRQIMNAPKDKVVDHINRNGLDNRKENLQLVSQQENTWNSERGANTGSSKYKGVNYDKAHQKYRATLCHNSGKIHLGYFENETDAAHAFDEAAKKYRGRFAILNRDIFGNEPLGIHLRQGYGGQGPRG
jgi:hypothetical protein